MAQIIDDSLNVLETISTPIYLGKRLQTGINVNQTETILTLPKWTYSAISMDVYLRSEQNPYAGLYALQTVYILINTPQESNTETNPYYGQVFITANTVASGPGALGTEADGYLPVFNPESIIYSADTTGENNILIQLTNNTRGAGVGVMTCETIVRSFIAGG